MSRRQYDNKIVNIVSNPWFNIPAAIAAILVWANCAHADWTLEETEVGIVAVLQNDITMADVDVPMGEHISGYMIHSGGGIVEAGRQIIKKLKTVNKPIGYCKAYSIAASIAVQVGATPLNQHAELGFHWAYIPGAGPTTQREFDYLVAEWKQMKKDIMQSNLKPNVKMILVHKLNEIRHDNQADVIVTVKVSGAVTIIKL